MNRGSNDLLAAAYRNMGRSVFRVIVAVAWITAMLFILGVML